MKKSLNEEWDKYVRDCYPDGMDPGLCQHIKLAWFAGALVASSAIVVKGYEVAQEASAIYDSMEPKPKVGGDR